MSPTTKLVKWQSPMRRVLMALVPVVCASVYFFGWRVLAVILLTNLVGFLTEYAFARPRNEPVTSAVFVTATLLALSLPPALPFWMAVVGVVFAVTFGKMVFGGFGKNIFNPALTGRAFLYVSFGGYMTALWHEPVSGPWGGWAAYAADAVTGATPGMALKTGAEIPFLPLLLGNTGGVMGGTCAILVIAGGTYLLWKKAANHRIVVSGLLGFLATQTLLWAVGPARAADPIRALFAGSFLFGIFFYATDPVSASRTNEGRWLYGAFIGIMSAVISVFSAWPAGTMFAILLANMFVPITDYGIQEWKKRRKPAGG